MHFELSEEQQMIRQAARDFAQTELKPGVIERDEHQKFPAEQIKKLGELGFLGMMVSPQYGGSGLDAISYVLVMEELSKIDASASVVVSVNNSLVCYGLEKYGTEEQKQKYLVPLATGEKIGAFCLSEPEAGSDATSQKTTAIDMGDHYLLNGTKNWITNGNSASTYLVIAQTDAAKKHHGINALIDENVPVVCIVPRDQLYSKMLSNLEQVKARNGMVIAIATEGDEDIRRKADEVIYIPAADYLLSPVLAIIPLQLLAYKVAVRRGTDVDQPRNLAKSVTVE